MTSHSTAEVARIADGLGEQLRVDLTHRWDYFCDGEPFPDQRDQDAFLASLENAGFIECVPVDDDALEDPFAYERGIEPGGMMWQLTDAGLAVRAHLEAKL